MCILHPQVVVTVQACPLTYTRDGFEMQIGVPTLQRGATNGLSATCRTLKHDYWQTHVQAGAPVGTYITMQMKLLLERPNAAGTNHFGHFVLATSLLEKMTAQARGTLNPTSLGSGSTPRCLSCCSVSSWHDCRVLSVLKGRLIGGPCALMLKTYRPRVILQEFSSRVVSLSSSGHAFQVCTHCCAVPCLTTRALQCL